MILDKNLLVSSAQAITATAASTDVIDQGVARDLGAGEDIKLLVQVSEAFVSAGGATLQAQWQGSSDNSTWSTYAESRAYAVAELPIGAQILPIDAPRPGGTAVLPRYHRLNYVVAVSTFSAGKVNAGLVSGRDDQVYYPPGVAIAN